MKQAASEGASANSVDAVAEPEPESRNLALRIHRSIQRLAPGWVRDLKVEIRRGVISLDGRCGSYYCKQLAQHAAMELAEGQRVGNRIEVA